jgi:hypothetical protein
VSGYRILGHAGDLTLSFSRDRLRACHFEPMDFRAVADDLERAFEVSPGRLSDGGWYHPDANIWVAAIRGDDDVWFLAFTDEDLRSD